MKNKSRKKNQKKVRKVVINVLSANELSDNEVKKIQDKFGSEFEIKFKIDKSIIGGIVIQRSNKYFDGSVLHQLDLLRDKLYNLKSYDKYK